MKMTAAAAIGALILAASAVPAFAGGYWDGGVVQSGPPGYADPNCPCYCPPPRQDYGDHMDDRRGWREQRDDRSWDSGWRDDGASYDDEDDAGPADYSDNGYYDVGPSYGIDEGGAGGFSGGSFNVGLGFDFGGRDRFHDRFRDQSHEHDMERHEHHVVYPPHMMQHDHQPYPQHSGGWGPMQPHQPMAGYHPTHMMASYGHSGGYGHPAAHGGGRRR